MNQTQKRLSIIKLAISITDLETIQLQILKLTPLKSDPKIEEILTLLQNESYAQAQARITDYIEEAPEEIHQRSVKTPPLSEISEEDQAIIDEFQLFVSPKEHETDKILEMDINDYPINKPKIKKEQKSVDYDALLNLDADDVLSDNIDIDLSHHEEKKEVQEDLFFTMTSEENDANTPLDAYVPKDNFFDEEKNDNQDALLTIDNTQVLKGTTNITKLEREIEETEAETEPIPTMEQDSTTNSYPPIPAISQKYINLKKQYPPIQKSYAKFDTVEMLLTKIAQEGYREPEMEEMLTYIGKLIEKTQYTEAAQLLLVCGSTESKFAQFMLARELYKGSVLTKNIEASFSLLKKLSDDDYPEALCDLGQFYENGIGTPKDFLKAEALFKEAYDLGIKRAKKHYHRLKKYNRSLFKKA